MVQIDAGACFSSWSGTWIPECQQEKCSSCVLLLQQQYAGGAGGFGPEDPGHLRMQAMGLQLTQVAGAGVYMHVHEAARRYTYDATNPVNAREGDSSVEQHTATKARSFL